MTDLSHVPARPLIKQDDRVAAAAAHLAFFAGFWLVGPVVIYVVKRKESRFVAFHAAQAALLQILYGGSAIVGAIVLLVLEVVAGVTHNPALAAILTLVGTLAIAGVSMLVVALHLVAAYRAWQGEMWSIPIAGSLARNIIGADEGAAQS